jgi:hypothetical protein
MITPGISAWMSIESLGWISPEACTMAFRLDRRSTGVV